ncbi:thiamine pyrophosphate-dependent enzyme [Tautonia rosea]|uniref:thiamine pyrophosphate-dependent enzyme n=1 Tax=Tautonia rosea TaxID=2728037 RepID=UPI0014766C16|nr:thiamine pyrophosphate-dependent enzyme [Tautonia rosea]
MPQQRCTGGEALALGALASGIHTASSYPGSPSSEVMEALIASSAGSHLQLSWASNERVALEVAIGASIAGRRALVCTKSVGLNVMLDPLMTLNLTPVRGGLVVILGDDPGGYGSQNDQDTRLIASMAEVPMLEPSTPAEAVVMIHDAFEQSEQFGLPVIVRETRSFAESSGLVEVPPLPSDPVNLGFERERWRFVPVPSNVVAKHRALHERLATFASWAEKSSYVKIIGEGDRAIIATGSALMKLRDVLGSSLPPGLRLVSLGVIHPLPEEALGQLMATVSEVLVLEETEPFVERQLKAIAHDHASGVRISGKLTGLLQPEGELFRWQITRALASWFPGFDWPEHFVPERESDERPPKRGYCSGCRYDEVLDLIDEVGRAIPSQPILVGDPGCLVTVAHRLDAKYAIGSAIAVAAGMAEAGVDEKVIALFGDSAFFHSALPALCHAVVRRSPILMVVLDNRSTLTSGDQPHPGTGRDAFGQTVPRLNLEQIASACGVENVRTVSLDDRSTLENVLRDAWLRQEPALVVVEILTPRDAQG